jgi:hypothetical protein
MNAGAPWMRAGNRRGSAMRQEFGMNERAGFGERLEVTGPVGRTGGRS